MICVFSKTILKTQKKWVLTSFGEKLQDENNGAPDVCACNYEEYQKWEIRKKLGLGGSDFEANFDFKNPQCYNSQCSNYGIKDAISNFKLSDLEICNQSVNFFSIDSETNEAIPLVILMKMSLPFKNVAISQIWVEWRRRLAVSATAEAKEAYDAAVLSGNATRLAAAKEILDSAKRVCN